MIVLVQICVLLWDFFLKSKSEMTLIRIKLLRSNLDKVLPVVAWLISGISVKSSYRKKRNICPSVLTVFTVCFTL